MSDIVDTWDDLPEIVQDVITSGAGTTAASLVTTGELPSERELASVITSAAVSSKAISSYLANNTGISEIAAAQITKVISDVSRTAYTGADPYEAYKASLSGVFQKDLNNAINKVTSGGLKAALDNITGSTATYENSLQTANENALSVDVSAESVNELISEAEAIRAGKVNIESIGFYGYADWQRDRDTYQNSGGSTAGVQALERLTKWNEVYSETIAPLPDLRAEYDNNVNMYTVSVDAVKKAEEGMFTSQQYLDTVSTPLFEVANKSFTTALRPEFNEGEYRELYSIPSNVDAHAHWLATGRSNFTNKKEFDTRINDTLREKVYDVAFSQEDKKWSSMEGYSEFENGLVAAARTAIGNDLEAAKNLNLSADPALTPAIAAINAYVNSVPDIPSMSAVERVAKPIGKTPDTTDADIASGKARLIRINQSLNYAASASGRDQALQFTTGDINWTKLTFNPNYNTETRTRRRETEARGWWKRTTRWYYCSRRRQGRSFWLSAAIPTAHFATSS